MNNNESLRILKKYWGHNHFRPLQQEIIESVLNNDDTLALLPTGGGKSVCFQIPALLKQGVCLVVSPLIALMEDQVNSINEKGIKAIYLKSGTSQDELITIFDNIRFGNYKFLYLSPERLQSKFIQEKIKQLFINLITVDEAHCISQWGHDFRPSYRNIKLIRKIHPKAPVIALTATATQKVVQDIQENLNLKKTKIFKQSLSRDNLYRQVVYTEDKLNRLKQILCKIDKTAIVYVNTRARTKQISTYLNNNSINTSFYHGGMSSVEKQIQFNKWKSEKTKVMVATNAFGMGIDKDNVRIVIHYNLPNSIEDYVQESGRAGRDQKKAFSVLLTNEADITIAKKNQKETLPSINYIKKVYKKLFQYFQIALGETIDNSLEFNLLDFCNKYNFIVKKVFTTLQLLNNFGVLEYQIDKVHPSTVKFLANPNDVYNYNQKQRKIIIQTLLRMYGGLFENETPINEFLLSKKIGITSWNLTNELEKLTQENIITYKKNTKTNRLFLLIPREDEKTINKISTQLKKFLDQKEKKLSNLIGFIEEKNSCRNIYLSNYFKETTYNTCNNCDFCTKKKKNNLLNIENDILNVLTPNKKLSSKQICEILHYENEKILVILHSLLASNKLKINQIKKFYIPQL